MDNKIKMLKNKRGQITIFVILGILLIAALILLFILFQDQIRGRVQKQIEKPSDIISQCVNEHLDKAIDSIFENGGYINKPSLQTRFAYPEGYYKDEGIQNITILCYTARDYARCTPTTPRLNAHLKNQIKDYIVPKINQCFNNLKSNLEGKGYTNVKISSSMDLNVELIPRRARIDIVREISAERAGELVKYETFSPTVTSPLYEVASLVEEIIEQEAQMCNSEYIELMQANTWAKITKFQTGEGMKIYTITDTRIDKDFKFAIRNCLLDVPS